MFRVKNSLKQGDASSPLLFNFVLSDVITMVQVTHEGLKLNGTHQLLVYADVVNILEGSVYTIKENTKALVVALKDNGIKVSAEKSKYMAMYCNKIALRSHNTRNNNSSFEKVEQFKYLETTLTDQNSIQEKIKSRLKSGIFYYYSM